MKEIEGTYTHTFIGGRDELKEIRHYRADKMKLRALCIDKTNRCYISINSYIFKSVAECI